MRYLKQIFVHRLRSTFTANSSLHSSVEHFDGYVLGHLIASCCSCDFELLIRLPYLVGLNMLSNLKM